MSKTFKIWIAVAVIAATALLYDAFAYACDSWPVEIGTMVREYAEHNGLIFREYDLDNDGKADYGTATQERAELPLFYAIGKERPDGPRDTRPFTPTKVYIDREGNGNCEDIILYMGGDAKDTRKQILEDLDGLERAVDAVIKGKA